MKSPAVKYVLGPLRRVLQRLPERNMLLVLSLFVGIACGLASVLLKEAIEWIHHGLTSWFGPEVTFNYLYLIYPGIGMLIAMLFVRHVIKDNIGHGVTKSCWQYPRTNPRYARTTCGHPCSQVP